MRFISPVEFEPSGSPFGQWTWIINLIYAGFLLFALWGAFSSYREITAGLLIGLICLYLLVAVLYFGGSRVALPIAPALIIFASISIDQIIGHLYKRPVQVNLNSNDF